ncbi:C39 family peptidase [Falsibacillus albus]|uniref:Hydrolase n=1 Tax=Falsibacillus albus TaxID=2478915 RepID=A0A3L7JU65_9BACI|nr:C39 family peptidase [Falsibacillus albus]RLQ93835.1 hydrolase [Falsibacillus albus]
MNRSRKYIILILALSISLLSIKYIVPSKKAEVSNDKGILSNKEQVYETRMLDQPKIKSFPSANNSDMSVKEKLNIETITHTLPLDVPLIYQMSAPKLYNGCEVTSLAMLLNYYDINVTKNDLAEKINYVPLTYKNGQKGNPNEGFVGDMAHGPGLGVYHSPILKLAQQYVGMRAIDITNQPFSEILKEVENGHPIWVITTANFAPVADFKDWDTPQGPIKVTYSEHSVVITGFDEDHIFLNDPYGVKNRKVSRAGFEKAWEQMGSQAVIIDE